MKDNLAIANTWRIDEHFLIGKIITLQNLKKKKYQIDKVYVSEICGCLVAEARPINSSGNPYGPQATLVIERGQNCGDDVWVDPLYADF